jgi:hypothetical protein
MANMTMASMTMASTHEPSQPARQVPVQLEMLDNAIAILGKDIVGLQAELTPILMQTVAIDPEEKAKEPALCIMAGRIRKATVEVEHLCRIVQQIRTEVQV